MKLGEQFSVDTEHSKPVEGQRRKQRDCRDGLHNSSRSDSQETLS